MKKIILLLLISIFALSCSDKKESDVLIMGTNPTFPPFEYTGGTRGDEVVGFDVEFAKIIAQNYGKKLVVESMDFDGLIPALQSGKIDMAISGMTITEERRKNVDFSDQYYEASQVVLIRKDDESFANIKTKEELGAQKSLGAQFGTTGSELAGEISQNVVELKSCELVVMELMNKKVDAVIIDKEPAKAFMSKNENLVILPINFDAEYYGIAVKKGNEKLLSVINDTINELVASGEYKRLVEEHINAYSEE